MENNLILATDSYKVSHWPLYPEGTTHLFSYWESRGGEYESTVFFGLQYYLLKYLTRHITQDDIEYAAERFAKHFGSDKLFNRKGWEIIVNELGGKLPLRIRAVPEGTRVPVKNVLLTVENTDPRVPWLTNYVETLLSQLWYPTTVATLSNEIREVIKNCLNITGDVSGLPFKLHDFGFRGVSSYESSAIGGAAHLVNFMGTDTMSALEFAKDYYDEDMAGFSIPATEHSIMSALGPDGELSQMRRFLQEFGDGPYPAIACVSDTYNIYHACKTYWGRLLKKKVQALENKVLVVRPDSGNPEEIVLEVLETLGNAFSYDRNDKGYKVLRNVRVIQGDGVDINAIRSILDVIIQNGWSADNIAFGMGGALLQKLNRDTQKFAFKASSIKIDGEDLDVYKFPITDLGKRSKAGRLKLIKQDGRYKTVRENEPGEDLLQTVFENGEVLKYTRFCEIKNRVSNQ